MFISTESILRTSKLDCRFFNTQTVRGTHSFYKIIPIHLNVFNACNTLDSKNYIRCTVTESLAVNQITAPKTGGYVGCIYLDNRYIELIIYYSEENNDYKISFLEMDSKNNRHRFFPQRKKTCWEKPEHILVTLTVPNIISGTKIVYSFVKKKKK